MTKRRILIPGIVDPIAEMASPGAGKPRDEGAGPFGETLARGADPLRGADGGRHRVEFVRRRAEGDDVVELFARLLQRGGRRVAWATAEGPGAIRAWVEFSGSPDLCRERCVVELGLEAGVDSLVVDMQPVPWQKSPCLGEGGDRGGGEFVAFGLLTWMYDQDPDEGRRLLENRLAGRGRAVVASALRRFELGWRGGPQWAPRPREGAEGAVVAGRRPWWSAFGAAEATAGGLSARLDFPAGGPSAASGIAPSVPGSRPVGSVPEGAAAALMDAAIAAGMDRCLPPPLHPAVGPLLAAYRRRGGRVVEPGRRDLAGGGRGSGQLWLVLDVAGEPRDVVDTEGPQVVFRLLRLSDEDGPFLPGETTPLTGAPNPLRSQGSVLAPTDPRELRDAVERAARRAEEDGRDVTVLLDQALFEGDPQLGGGDPDKGRASGATGGAAAAGPVAVVGASSPGPMFGPDVSPMNCRAFAPAALEEGFAEAGGRALPAVGHLFGGDRGDVLFVGWGSTREPTEAAALRLRRQGVQASSLHLTQMYPLSPAVGRLLAGFHRVIVVEAATESRTAPARGRAGHTRDLLHDCLRAASGSSSLPAPTLHSWIIPLGRRRAIGRRAAP